MSAHFRFTTKVPFGFWVLVAIVVGIFLLIRGAEADEWEQWEDCSDLKAWGDRIDEATRL